MCALRRRQTPCFEGSRGPLGASLPDGEPIAHGDVGTGSTLSERGGSERG
jgi:hypothetical protein